jgi:hypothetical protein
VIARSNVVAVVAKTMADELTPARPANDFVPAAAVLTRSLDASIRRAVRTAKPRRFREGVKPRSVGPLPLTDKERMWLQTDEAELRAAGLLRRPRTVAECPPDPDPCPWFGCRHHLGLTVDGRTGAIKLTWPDKEIDEIEGETCSLRYAAKAAIEIEASATAGVMNPVRSLEDVSRASNVTLEMSNVVLKRALSKLRAAEAFQDAPASEAREDEVRS